MDFEDCEKCGVEVDWVKYDYCPYCVAGETEQNNEKEN